MNQREKWFGEDRRRKSDVRRCEGDELQFHSGCYHCLTSKVLVAGLFLPRPRTVGKKAYCSHDVVSSQEQCRYLTIEAVNAVAWTITNSTLSKGMGDGQG
jgi:hypothetical protein